MAQLEGSPPSWTGVGVPPDLFFFIKPSTHPSTHRRLPRKYEYYIFMDDDAYTTSYQAFEDLLLKWRPAVGVPGGAVHLPPGWTRTAEALRITSFDAMLNAYHRDVVFSRSAAAIVPFWALPADSHPLYSSVKNAKPQKQVILHTILIAERLLGVNCMIALKISFR